MGEVLHVEIARKTNSSLRRKEILNLVKKAVDNFENPVRDFCIHNHRHLFDHVEFIKLCSYSKTWKTCRSDEKYADSEKKTHSLLARFPTPTVIKKEYYMFKLFEGGEHEENLEASFSNDEPRVSHHWVLPSAQFHQEWESLVFEPSIKTRLLDYMKMAIIYSQKHVNDSLIAWSKVVLIHGPPGTGKTSLCKAFAHKATIRLGGYFDYGQLIEINSNSLFSKYFSESGKLIEKMFSKIHDLLEDQRSIVFLHIDEVESLANSRKNTGGSLASDNIRAVNCLLTQLDKVKRFPNLVILTTSNIVDSIDVAFVDRADIKLCIGNPSADLVYEIYAGSINELIRCDIIQTNDNSLLPPTIQTTDANDSCYDNAQKLWNISVSSVNLSGRTLKRIPFLTHCNYVKSFDSGCTLEEYLDGMILAVEKEKSEVQIIAEKIKSDKPKIGNEDSPQFVTLVKHSSPSPSCTSPCVSSSTKFQWKNRTFTASSLSSNLNSGTGTGSCSSSSSSSSFTSSSVFNYDSDAESRARSNAKTKTNPNVNINTRTSINERSIVPSKVNTTTQSSKTRTLTPKSTGQLKPPEPKRGRLRSMSISRSRSRSPSPPKPAKKLQVPVKEGKRTATASAVNKVGPEPESESEPEGEKSSKTQNHTCKTKPTKSKSPEKETKSKQLEKETKSKQLEKETKSKQLEKETKSKQLEKETKSKQLEKETKSKSPEKETKSKPLEKETKSKPLEKETKSKPLEKEAKAKILEKEAKAKILEKETKAKTLEKEIKSKLSEKETKTLEQQTEAKSLEKEIKSKLSEKETKTKTFEQQTKSKSPEQETKCKIMEQQTKSKSPEKETKPDDKIKPTKASNSTTMTPPTKKRSRKTPPGDDPGKLAVPEKRQKPKVEKPESQPHPANTGKDKEIDGRRMKRFTTKYRLQPLYIDLSKSTCTSDGVLIPFKPSQSSSINRNKTKPMSEQPICVSLENCENDPVEVEGELETKMETIKENQKIPEPELRSEVELALNVEYEFNDPPFADRPPTPTPCIPPNFDVGNITPYEDPRNRLISQFLGPLSPNSNNMTMGPPMTPRNPPGKDEESYKLDEAIFKPESPKSSDTGPDFTENIAIALPLTTKSNSLTNPPSTNLNQSSLDSCSSSAPDLNSIEAGKEQQNNKTLEKQQQPQQEKDKEEKHRNEQAQKPQEKDQEEKHRKEQAQTPQEKDHEEKHRKEQAQKPQVKEPPQPKNLKPITLNGASTSLNKPSANGSQNHTKTVSSTPNSNSHAQSQQSTLPQNKTVTSTSKSTLILPKANETKTTTTTTKTTPTASASPSKEKSTNGPKIIKKTRKTIQKVIRVRAGPVRLVRKLKSKTNASGEVNPTPTNNSNSTLKPQSSTGTLKTLQKPSLPMPLQKPNGAVVVKKVMSNTNQSSSGPKSTTVPQLKVKPTTTTTTTKSNASTTINTKTNNNASTNVNPNVNMDVTVAPSTKEASGKIKTQLPVSSNNNIINNNNNKKPLPASSLFATFDKIKTAAERKMIVKPKSPQKQPPQSTSTKPPTSTSLPTTNNEQVESTHGKTKTNVQPSNDRTEIPGCSNRNSSSQDVGIAASTTTSLLKTKVDLSDAKKLGLEFKVHVLNGPEESEDESKSPEPESLSRPKSVEEQGQEGGNSIQEFTEGNKLICSHCNTEFPQNPLDKETERERVTAVDNFQPTACSNCGKERDVFSCSLCGLLYNSEEHVEEHEATCLESIDTPPPHEDSEDTGSGSDDLVLGLDGDGDLGMELELGGRCGWSAASLFPIVDDHDNDNDLDLDHDHDHDSVYGRTELTEQDMSHPNMTSISSPGSFGGSFGPGSNQMPSSVSSQTSEVLSTEFSSPTMSSYNSSSCPTPQHQHHYQHQYQYQHNNHSYNSPVHNSHPSSTFSTENDHRHPYSLSSPAHTQTQRQMYPSPRVMTSPCQSHSQSQSQQLSQPFMSLNDLTGALLDPSIPMNPAIRAAVQEHFSIPQSLQMQMPMPMPIPMPMPMPLCPLPVPLPPPVPVPVPTSAPIPVSLSVSGSNFHTCRFCHRCFISVQEMRQHVLKFHAGPVPAQLQLQENESQSKQSVNSPALAETETHTETETQSPLQVQSEEVVDLPNNNSNSNSPTKTVGINGHQNEKSQSPKQNQDPIPTPVPVQKEIHSNNLDTPHVSNHQGSEGSVSTEREESSLSQS